MKRRKLVLSALLAVFWSVPLSAQQATGTIRGRVTDSASQVPLVQATVNAGSHAAITQADGRYEMRGVPAGSYTVRVRLLGYSPVTKPVTVEAGQTVTADLAMTAEAVNLSEIVVVGYGQQKLGDLPSAVDQINSEDFNPGTIVQPAALIQDKVAGVQVINDDNAPGGGISIRIRGSTSANASNDPLYVVDGMPVSTGAGGGLSAGRDPLNFLNPNDIASITVLKDASAAAIYGTNSANGVVLITTKSGSSSGRVGSSLDYTTTASASSVVRTPSVLSATQFRAAVAHDDSLILAGNPTYTPRAGMLGSANTDWFNTLDRTGYGTEQNLAYTNSAEARYYRLSFGYLKSDGIIRNSSTERLSLGLNYDQRLLDDRLDVKLNLKGARTNDVFQSGGALGDAVGMAPTQPIYNSTAQTGYWNWVTTGASASNPLEELNLSTDDGTTWRSIGNLEADYQLPWIQGLRANMNVGYDVTQANRETFLPNDLGLQLRQGHGYLSMSNDNQVNSVFEAYLNYSNPLDFMPGNVDLTGGYSYGQSHSVYPFFQESGLSSNLLGIYGVPTATTVQNSENVVDSKLISFFGRLNYNLNDRYLLSVSLRRDGSSRFGPGNQWGTFPAVSAAWRLSQESFFKSIPSLSDLKLRASWAKTGNQAFADYQQYPTITYSNAQAQYEFGNTLVTTIRPAAVDPNIKWEETSSYDVGLDYGFLGQRISGSIDWYTKKTSDLIFTVPVAAFTNFSNYLTTNIGASRNNGLELSLDAEILRARGNGLGWTADFTASHNTNTLLSINPSRSVPLIQVGGVSGGVGTTIQVLEPGVAMNSFYVCQQYFDPTTHKPVEGQFLSLPDSMGKQSVVSGCDSRGLRAYHNPEPTWIFGHTSSFRYGSFDFGFTVRAYVGNYVYNNVASSNGAYQNVSNGGSPSNMSTSVLRTGFVVPQFLSDYYVENGSFLRMDNITLGYTFHVQGQAWRAFVTVQNAFTITGYSGVDPTAGLNGIDNNIYPASRTVTGGLSVRL